MESPVPDSPSDKQQVVLAEQQQQKAANGHLPSPEVEDSAEDELGEVPAIARTKSGKSILKSADTAELKLKRSVSWHDFSGKELHTVREFTPSEHDDEELLVEPEKKGACCVIC
ncbi:hypothetical protein OEZ85_007742 [Tetradesmus obliquus]|uniref:Uncharacterized protein n=1 Tax=Tetradesmus obliquus TaxID=3088 RepID=A0ABY8THB0_TETOB|nr:hypothetical protein OEZ85_007742 [Tetradesmus obliquus]